jgi:hypothetical protein
MARQFIIKRNGEAESGPFTKEQLKAMLDSGELSPGTPTRRVIPKRWWIPAGLGWLPVEMRVCGILSGFRIPLGTLLVWAFIGAAALGLLVLKIYLK